MKNIRIFLVDDHLVVREGLRLMLGQEADMEIVGQGASGQEVLSRLEGISPNIVLMDIKMPGMDGIELTRLVKQRAPACKIIILTLYNEYLKQAVEAGAVGYLTKDIKREQLTQAIRRVYCGEIVVGEDVTRPATCRNLGIGDDTLVQEVQLIIPLPVEASYLMRFATQVEETFQCRLLQVVGSWPEGTAMTVVLNQVMPLEDIINKVGEIPEVEVVGEEPAEGISESLLGKAAALPRLKSGPRKTLFITLKKETVLSGVLLRMNRK